MKTCKSDSSSYRIYNANEASEAKSVDVAMNGIGAILVEAVQDCFDNKVIKGEEQSGVSKGITNRLQLLLLCNVSI